MEDDDLDDLDDHDDDDEQKCGGLSDGWPRPTLSQGQ